MLDEINFILQHTNSKTIEKVLDDVVLYQAIIRSLEIKGRASPQIELQISKYAFTNRMEKHSRYKRPDNP